MRSPDDVRAEIDNGENVTRLHAKLPLGAKWARDAKPNIETGVVDGLLSQGELSVIYGESGAGKSFAAVDLAAHVATGRDWFGHKVTEGPVLYVAAERPKETERRFYAWCQRHKVTELDVLVTSEPIDLLNGEAGATDDIIKLSQWMTEQCSQSTALIIVDTLARASAGADENAGKDMGLVIRNLDRIRAQTGAAVVVIHHCGKDASRGGRGWSGVKGAVTAELCLTSGDGGAKVLEVVKANDGPEGAKFAFKLEPHGLGKNTFGRSVTTCTVTPCDAPVTPQKPPKLSPRGKLVVSALKFALNKSGERPPSSDMTKDIARAVTEETLRRYFDQANESTKDSTRRMAWSHGLENAKGHGVIEEWGGWLWLKASRHS